MKIIVTVDGAERGSIEWDGPVEGVAPDDIRLARKLKADDALWKELVAKRIVGTTFSGSTCGVLTKAGSGAIPTAGPGGKESYRALESDHPFKEACDWGGPK
jgi:hypothetical protein